jgi:lipoate-protein ligase A
MITVRLLSYAAADGPHNMAADEALLETAIAGSASLRFYGWSEATLSLGYFQPQSVRFSDPLLAGLPWVRRPTGGAALVHHYELTYALALPSGAPWQKPGEPWLERMHGILAEALVELGARPENVVEESKRGDILCFLHHTPGDLRIGRAKVVGSAQRRLRGALLQHGAVLLAASPFAPTLPGVAESVGRRPVSEELASAIADRFVGRTGWRLEPSDGSDQERRRTESLAAEKYSRPSWNAKR